MVRIALKTLKYFSTLFVLALALIAGWWLWNYYMQSPWTRDGKIRAEQVSITPQVSGSISALLVKDNQFVHAGDVLFRIDETLFTLRCSMPVRSSQKLNPIWQKPITKPNVADICRGITSLRKISIPPISM